MKSSASEPGLSGPSAGEPIPFTLKRLSRRLGRNKPFALIVTWSTLGKHKNGSLLKIYERAY